MDKVGGGAHANIAHAVIIILLLFIIYKMARLEFATDQVYTSGADMRRLGQTFTSTDQGTSDYVSNLTIIK